MRSTLYAYVLLSLLHFTCLTTAYSLLPRAVCQRREVISRQYLSAEPNNDMDVVARRIIVVGAVHGGYYRACVKNEASRFRKLVGTMSPPDDSDEAEIYIEGKPKMVDGFIRWCQRGNVGLSQVISVREVIEEEPTGLYDAFYVQVKP